MVRAVKKQLGPVTEEEKGPRFEGWMFTLLKAYAEARGLYDEIFYWAPFEFRRTAGSRSLRARSARAPATGPAGDALPFAGTGDMNLKSPDCNLEVPDETTNSALSNSTGVESVRKIF